MNSPRITKLMRRARLHEERAEVLRDKANELYQRDQLNAVLDNAEAVVRRGRIVADQSEAAGYGPALHLVPELGDLDTTEDTTRENRWTYVAVLTHDPRIPIQDRGQIVGIYESRRAAEHAIQTYAVSLIGSDWTEIDFDLGQVQSYQRGTSLHPTSVYVGGGSRPFRLGASA